MVRKLVSKTLLIMLIGSIVIGTGYAIINLKKPSIDVTVNYEWNPYKDDTWHCNTTFIFTNTGKIPFTISEIIFEVTDMIYVDDTSENIGISNNLSMNREIQVGESTQFTVIITEAGFEKETRSFDVNFQISIAEIKEKLLFNLKLQ